MGGARRGARDRSSPSDGDADLAAHGERGNAREIPSFLPSFPRARGRRGGTRTICSGDMFSICFCANAIISGVIMLGSMMAERCVRADAATARAVSSAASTLRTASNGRRNK